MFYYIIRNVVILFSLSLFTPCFASPIEISQFAKQTLKHWQVKRFSGLTEYRIIKEDNRWVLNAKSNQSASGLIKKITINLLKTPYLNWSWKSHLRLHNLNEHDKTGDDYVARIYLIKSGGIFIWKTRSLNYVWSSNQQKNKTWTSPYTEQSKMIAVQGKSAQLDHWYQEKRNVREDFKRLFSIDIKEIDVIAIMTDTDNSKQRAESFFADLYFTAN